MVIRWDEKKRLRNLAKHGFDFRDAEVVFTEPRLEMEDTRRDYGEKRYIVFGYLGPVIVALVYARRDDYIRIVSIRKANKREKKKYFRHGLGTR